MATTTYGIMTESGELLFKGYYTESEATASCESLNAVCNCRVVKVVTTIEVSEL